MTSAFAAQLGQIAATSSNELDLKAQKAAHSQSLIFERKAAGSQDFETIYQICLEGFEDLCQLDRRFLDFQRNIFNAQSKDQDRMQMTAQENEALDIVLEQFLSLIGSRLLLRPAMKALEWLIRRFQVHIYNTSYLISTFLPYHEAPIFRSLLSILQSDLPFQYRFLAPYLETATNPPRHAIAYSATSSDQFFATLCSYTLQTCRQDASYTLLLTFWTTITTEAVASRLSLARSGRSEVQRQRQEDVLLKVLPVLNEGLSTQNAPEMVLACYAIVIILANMADLADSAINSLMEAIALTLSTNDMHSGLVCLSILAECQATPIASRKLLACFIPISDLAASLEEVDKSYSVSGLVLALARRAMQGLKKSQYAARIQFVVDIATSTTWHSMHVSLFLRDILQAIASMSENDAVTSAIKARLLDLLRRLCQLENFVLALRQAPFEFGVSREDLESLMGQVTDSPSNKEPMYADAEAMEIDARTEPENMLESAFKHIPERTVNEHTFLTVTDSPLYKQLSEAYQLSSRQRNGSAEFYALPVWHTGSQEGSNLYVSFLLRISCGPYSELCRSAALRAIAHNIDEKKQSLDSQALLYYVIPRLADTSHNIRRAAAEVLIAMHSKAPQDIIEGQDCQRLGADDLVDASRMEAIRWIPASDLAIILKSCFLPALEECVADPNYILQVVQKTFVGNVTHMKANHHHSLPDVKELKKAVRHGFFDCLLSHVVATPLLATKVDMIQLLGATEKVGSTFKSRALKSVVQQWAVLSIEEAITISAREGLEISYVDNAMVKLVNSSDKDAASALLDLVIDIRATPRSSLLESLFEHMAAIWPKMLPEAQAVGSQKLIDLSLSASDLSERAREVLLSLDLPAGALVRVLHAAFTIADDFKNTTPHKKRRRSSSGTKAPSALSGMVSHMTLVLEMIDSSKPENHLELLPGLFEALGVLQNLKRLSRRDHPYLLNLCLGSMLAIVGRLGPSPKIKKDLAAVRIELVTDCIKLSDSPQVQNTAILLSAELARVVPEKILHNAMPIFTFLGSHALTKDDDYSVYVVNQAIDQIIPLLMQTLQTQRKDVAAATSDLLSSFSAGFEHIPEHRRLGLFRRLVSKLDADGILNTLIAMLMLRNTNNVDTGAFVTSLMSSFPVSIQLQTLHDLLSQALQIRQGNDNVAKMLMATENVDRDASLVVLQVLLAAAEGVLSIMNLGVELGLSQKHNEEAASAPKSELLSTLRLLMQLARDTAENEQLGSAVDHCTEALVKLIPAPEFLNLCGHCLSSEDTNWHQDALLLLEARLAAAAARDFRGGSAPLAMLTTLTGLINEKEHDQVKHGAIRCIDRITELCGRQETSTIVQAATVLATSQVINSEKPALQTITLLCLASMLDCVKEAIIPVVPKIMSMSVVVLKESLTEDAEDARLHDAAYALISAIISNVCFMISENDLDNILKLSADSVHADLGPTSQTARQDTLALLARNVDIKQLVPSLRRTWPIAVENDVEAVNQALDILGNAVKLATKGGVMALADQVSDLFTQMLDLRRVQFTQRDEDSYTDKDVSAVEDKVNRVAIEFIYKLNDTAFRPLLIQWLDWTVKSAGIPSLQLEAAKMHRQTAVFGFLAHFFGTLKSIVTSYATHALEPAVKVMQSAAALANTASTAGSFGHDQRLLWLATLDMLAEAYKYDQDSYFASPSQFSALSEILVTQLRLACDKTLQKDVIDHIIPAIVAFAFATIDTSSHHKDVNHHICQMRHSEAVEVRMASIQAQHALIASEDVGEEWVNNVVQGGGETMVYINEMLEDDDEDVEREVRKWVRKVREMVGEDLFEV